MKLNILLMAALLLGASEAAVAQRQESVTEGVVLQVKPFSRILSIRDSVDRKRKDIYVPEGSTITMDGRTAKLRNFERGSMATVRFFRRADGVNEAVVARVPDTNIIADLPATEQVASAATTATMLPKAAGSQYLSLFTGLGLLAAGCLLWLARLGLLPLRSRATDGKDRI